MRGLAALFLAVLLASPAGAEIRRFALVASSNNGGPERVTLQYADSDARAVAGVLEELGGVRAADRLLLLDTDRSAVEAGLRQLEERLKRSGREGLRTELLFYYSGHADERGLLIGGERLDYRSLRRALDRMPADVRVAIVDSCASGSLTRAKGGQRRAPFLVDSSAQVSGLAIITSSTASEASQESDSLGASFFTHYLVSGLRGAADADRDGRITLGEAYQFTFQRTLARTEQTQRGAQHPAYDMQLAGTGDLVLTDLRGTGAVLVLGDALEGRVLVRDAQGRPAVELHKLSGQSVELGLQPGRYRITVERDESLQGAELELDASSSQALGLEQLVELPREPTLARGGVAYTVIPVELSLMPAVTTNGFFGERTVNYFSLSLLAGRTARLYGLGIGILAHWVDEQMTGMQLTGGANMVNGEAAGFQLAGLANLIWGSATLVQFAAGANLAGADLRLGQIAAGTNLVRGDLTGAQLISLFNLVGGALTGVQLGAGFNLAGGAVRGLQLALGGNLARGPLWGAQIGPAGANVAEAVAGLQLGAVNIGTRISGLQLGLVNVADEVDGAQIGLVNVSRRVRGAPVGLVNVIAEGMLHPVLWVDDVALLNLALRYGSSHAYSQVIAGLQPLAEAPRWQLGFGLGGRLEPLASIYVDVDGSVTSLHRGAWTFQSLDLQPRLRVTLGYRFLSHLAVEAGLSLNMLLSTAPGAALISPVPSWVIVPEAPLLALWPGAHVGVQF